MSGLRRQVAPLPPLPSNLARSAEAYAAGHAATGETLFRDAFLDVMPLVRRVVHRHLEGAEDREDAIQVAMTNIWNAVQRGIEPAIVLYATGAAIDRFRRETRHEARRASPNGYTVEAPFANVSLGLDGIEWVEKDLGAEDDATDDVAARAEVARIASLLGAVRPLWGDIAICLALGLTQFEAARALKRPPGTVTRNVVEMRLHLEQLSAA